MDNLIKEFDQTEANALVIDFKDDFGRVVCETESPLIKQLGSTKVYIEDMAGLMKKLKEHTSMPLPESRLFVMPGFLRYSRTGA